jgi:hypothetical protein
LHEHIRYQLEVLESPERLVKSLKSLATERLRVKFVERDPARITFRMSRRDGDFELFIDGEILRGKANTSLLRFRGELRIPPFAMRMQRGFVILCALLASFLGLALSYWLLPVPIGLVDTSLFVAGLIGVFLGISTVAWLADFFLVRRAMSQERQKCQKELRLLVEAIFARVQPAVLDYDLDETETIPA